MIGLRIPLSAATAPAARSAPRMIAASWTACPRSSSAAPRPALKTGSSSSTITAACTAASASPPPPAPRGPPRRRAATPASAAAWCSGCQLPAPPWTTIVITGTVQRYVRAAARGRRPRRPPSTATPRASDSPGWRGGLEALAVEPLRADHDRGPLRAGVHVAHRQVEPPGDAASARGRWCGCASSRRARRGRRRGRSRRRSASAAVARGAELGPLVAQGAAGERRSDQWRRSSAPRRTGPAEARRRPRPRSDRAPSAAGGDEVARVARVARERHHARRSRPTPPRAEREPPRERRRSSAAPTQRRDSAGQVRIVAVSPSTASDGDVRELRAARATARRARCGRRRARRPRRSRPGRTRAAARSPRRTSTARRSRRATARARTAPGTATPRAASATPRSAAPAPPGGVRPGARSPPTAPRRRAGPRSSRARC